MTFNWNSPIQSLDSLVGAAQSGILQWPISEVGLSAPVRPTALALENTMAEFVTLEQMVGKSASLDEIVAALRRFTLDAVLIGCAQVLHGLFRHPMGMKAAEHELAGDLPPTWQPRFQRLAALADRGVDSVVATPQAMLSLAKLAILTHEPKHDQQTSVALSVTLALGIAISSHLERDMVETEEYWGQQADLLVYMFANHYLCVHSDDAAQIARARLLETLRREVDPDLSNEYDIVFRNATGSSPAAARVMASSLWAGTQTGPLLGESFGSNAIFSHEEREAAIATACADAQTLKAEIALEHQRLGKSSKPIVSWAFNTFRKFPVVNLADGRRLVLHPGFLVDHIFDFDYDRRVQYSLPPERQERFRTFRGESHERLVESSLRATFPSPLAKSIWVDKELGAIWKERHCDFLIDSGTAILLIEVTSHPITERAIAGISIHALDKELETMIMCKARQLDQSLSSLLLHEDEMLGANSSTLSRPIIPMIVATSGFPWNLMTARSVRARLKAESLLEGSRVMPLTVSTLDGIEAMESVAEAGKDVTQVILRGLRGGDTEVGFDHLLFRQGEELRRPMRLDQWWPNEFRDMAESFGFDPNDLCSMPDDESETSN